jgi:cytoskeletal protein CcmA (bactofilin family)
MLPETTIGEAVSIKGSLAFDRLLRIDGSFEGELRSSGDLVVGARGTLKGDIKGMNRVVVDGTVVGDIQCESLEVRQEVRLTVDCVCNVIARNMEVDTCTP